jgi:hypothetical protein
MINTVRDPQCVRQCQNFEQESQYSCHPGTPGHTRIYDYFTQNERSYLIIEFIEGKDLEGLDG